jgi:hypothetical protein
MSQNNNNPTNKDDLYSNLKNKVNNINSNNMTEKIQETVNKNTPIVTKDDYYEIVQKFKELDLKYNESCNR